jgi:hypothetical protein
MADNVAYYGYRLFTGAFAQTNAPLTRRLPVASNYDSTAPVGTAGVGFRPGDVVSLTATGDTLQHTVATGVLANQNTKPLGVVGGIDPWFDVSIGQAGAMRRADNLPAGIVYGTNLERQSNLLIIPVEGNTFEVDVVNNTTFNTLALLQGIVGLNAELIYSAVAPKAFPRLDLTAANVTGANTRQWRIVGISPSLNNQDFTGLNVKLLVVCNIPQNAPFNTLGS